jgi:hypothetical protein
MRKITAVMVMALLAVFSVYAGENADESAVVALGDSRERVIELLGEPTGEIRSKSLSILSYPQGKVELRDGVVSEVNLMSAEELRKRREQSAARLRRQQQRREKLKADGLRVKNGKLSDVEFLASPLSDQLFYWKEFSKMYPDVDVSGIYRDLQQRQQKEQKEQREDAMLAKIKQLEKRVDDAEQRAAAAENAQQQSINFPQVYDDGAFFYPDNIYPSPPIIWYNNVGCREPRANGGSGYNRRLLNPGGRRYPYAVHPESPFSNGAIRAIRSSKNSSMGAFRR